MAYIAIRTKYLGPTTYRGARIKATLDEVAGHYRALDAVGRGYGYQVINSYDDELDTVSADGWNNHKKAAQELADQFFNKYANKYVQQPEPIKLIGGTSKDGYVWVRVADNQVGDVI
jgi:hypothetical protein